MCNKTSSSKNYGRTTAAGGRHPNPFQFWGHLSDAPGNIGLEAKLSYCSGGGNLASSIELRGHVTRLVAAEIMAECQQLGVDTTSAYGSKWLPNWKMLNLRQYMGFWLCYQAVWTEVKVPVCISFHQDASFKMHKWSIGMICLLCKLKINQMLDLQLRR